MSARVEVDQLYTWAGKTWRVVSIKNGTARIVNVDRPSNTARMPLSQFRPEARTS